MFCWSWPMSNKIPKSLTKETRLGVKQKYEIELFNDALSAGHFE